MDMCEAFSGKFNSILAKRAAMLELLRLWTGIHEILCSNLSIINHGMTLVKSLMAKLPRVTHSLRTNISVSTFDARSADAGICKTKKMLRAGSVWNLIIITVGPIGR